MTSSLSLHQLNSIQCWMKPSLNSSWEAFGTLATLAQYRLAKKCRKELAFCSECWPSMVGYLDFKKTSRISPFKVGPKKKTTWECNKATLSNCLLVSLFSVIQEPVTIPYTHVVPQILWTLCALLSNLHLEYKYFKASRLIPDRESPSNTEVQRVLSPSKGGTPNTMADWPKLSYFMF